MALDPAVGRGCRDHMVNTYTLDEAARVLGLSTDEARKQLKKENVREFQDPSRKTFRYPSQSVDELARRLGQGSDPQLQLSDAGRSRSSDSPPPRKSVPEDQVDIGAHPASDKPSSKKRLTGSKSPTPRKSSDSDVRLVAEGSDLEFQVAGDSDVKMIDESAPSPKDAPAKTDSGVRVIPPEHNSDSDVKIVPDASDSGEVQMHKATGKSPSDSDIRLHSAAKKDDSDSSIHTDEIDLDEEIRRASEKKGKKTQAATGRELPKQSPYELSEADVNLAKKDDTSEDFILTPGQSSSSSEIELGSDEMRKLSPSDSALLASPSDSGINLKNPADSGVSLEKKGDSSSDEGEFELSVDSGSTPSGKKEKKDKKSKLKQDESSSEFELSLEDSGAKKKKEDSSSEFELSLDVEGSSTDGSSDSEFELTLDDSGGLAPIEEEKKDIFETDFEVPALDDESGKPASTGEGDTDLESSDFDIALEEGDAEADDAESGSQVVALDDESEADEGAATVARPRRGAAALEDEEEVDELLGGEPEEEGAEEMVGAGIAAEPEPWGPVPAIGLGLSAVVLILVLFISYEQIQQMWGYRTGSGVSSTVTRAIGGMFSDLPKE